MAVIKSNYNDRKLLARLIRAEAEGEGEQGMLLVANVGVNRVRSVCLDFVDINSVERMVWQSPGGFEAVHFPYFFQSARQKELRLVERAIQGERWRPAEFALWFFRPDGPCPEQWWNQWNSGRYKQHCFYIPTQADCPDVYGTF